jgi:omega-amidase
VREKARAGEYYTRSFAYLALAEGSTNPYHLTLFEYVCLMLRQGAFNTVTGPVHWELLQRGRALDNQVFVATVSPARNPESKYQAWGHSSVVDPWGQVLATTEHDAALVECEIDIARVGDVRQSVPVTKQFRTDVYNMVSAVQK